MENNTENANSSNGDNQPQDLDTLDAAALKEVAVKERATRAELEAKNRQLFERAKKAEGFEQDADGNWVKTIIKESKAEKKPDAKAKPSNELDYGLLAFHNSKTDAVKIEHADDIEFLKTTIEDSGKSQQDILGAKWFLSELKERQDARAVKDATPSGTKRGSGESNQSKPEYWLAKGELPPNTPANKKLRQDIVELRYQREKGLNRTF